MIGTYNAYIRNIKRKGKVNFDHSTTLKNPHTLFEKGRGVKLQVLWLSFVSYVRFVRISSSCHVKMRVTSMKYEVFSSAGYTSRVVYLNHLNLRNFVMKFIYTHIFITNIF